MPEEFLGRVQDGKIVGLTSGDAETLANLEGGEYRCVLTVPAGRSLSQLKLYWAVCGMIADNFEHPTHELHKEHVDRILRLGAGHSIPIELADGTYQFLARPIAFNALSQGDFNLFMDRALTVASHKFGPALADAAKRELEKMIAGQPVTPKRKNKKIGVLNEKSD
jgi:hypothetical protein